MKIERNTTLLIHLYILIYTFAILAFVLFVIDFLVSDVHNILLLVGLAQGVYLSAFAAFLINRYIVIKKDIEDVKKGIK